MRNDSFDKRNKLEDEIFTYQITKNKKVFIYCHRKHVTTLSGNKAENFIEDIKVAEGKDAQLIMAVSTGNFKHGNERTSKK